jgi:hypothetical protein
MFPVSRPFRQATATVVLLLLTAVPTGFVGAIAWRINRPGHVRDVEIDLGRALGLQVSLDAVDYPRPGEIDYRGIVLRQEEPRGKALAEIARAASVRVERTGRELTLVLTDPNVRGESPVLALSQLAHLIQRSAPLPFERLSVTATSCQIDLGREDLQFTIRDLAGEFRADASRPALTLAYRIQGKGGQARCELTLERDRNSEPPRTRLVLKTAEGAPLSARVLDVFFDADDWLGNDATVEGALSLSQEGSKDWEVEFSGELAGVDMARLTGRRFPRHRLTGRAKLVFQKARWGNRQSQAPGWVEVRGSLLVGQGTIGTSLIESLAREMRFRPSSRLIERDPRKADVEFRALGFSFAMESTGEIEIKGGLGADLPPDAVLAGATRSLLAAPAGTASVHGLIKTLFPVAQADPGVVVPLTAESQILLALPFPKQPPGRQTVEGN